MGLYWYMHYNANSIYSIKMHYSMVVYREVAILERDKVPELNTQVLNNGKLNRMQKRSLRTREKLLKATSKLVLKKGVEKTTMDDISESADLGRRTLYYHFESKEECILEAVAATYQKHADLMDQQQFDSDDFAVKVATASITVLNAIVSEKITKRVVDYPNLLAQALDRSILKYAISDIREGVASERFKLVHKEEVLNRILTWALVASIISISKEETSPADTFSAFAHIYLMSLGIDSAEALAMVNKVKQSV